MEGGIQSGWRNVKPNSAWSLMLCPASGLVPPGGQIGYCYKIPGQSRAAALSPTEGPLQARVCFLPHWPRCAGSTTLPTLCFSKEERTGPGPDPAQAQSKHTFPLLQHSRVRCPTQVGSPGYPYLLSRAADSPLCSVGQPSTLPSPSPKKVTSY